MPSLSRRDALKSLPALAVGLAGCTALAEEDHESPVPTAWQTKRFDPTPGAHPEGGPLIVGSRSPFRDDAMLAAVDPETGEERWSIGGGKGRGSPVAADDRHAYVFSKAETAFAVDYSTGEITWETSVAPVDEADPGVVEFAPIPAGEQVYVPISGTEDDVPDRVEALATADGSVQFVLDLPASLSGAPARDRAGLVAPLLDGTLRRVTADGTEDWRLEVGAAMSDVAVADGTVYVGSATEELLAVDADTGEVQWRSPLENTVFTRPLVADGRVYVAAADYYLYGIDAATGERRWRTETLSAFTSGPELVDGLLVSMVGGQITQRGPSGTVPFTPEAVYVHDTDGTEVAEYRFEGYHEGGSPMWVAVMGDAVYVGQEWSLSKAGPEVTDVA
ncbi:outer membrane protein assembly factor BamB family protein [Haloarchaeobius amylolyticus]|uniref:outer membrane protein assembly factor BamB family protein n=1 Tax=Haloarchaeobius amylolyticus TaxID=1198296 RepID=UPI00227207D1|nr:PQQ-binding-like beta-propeller repeat protein [Haloarchaeobius amylolyticus]